MSRLLRRILLVTLALAVVAAIAWALLPGPVPVEMAAAARGPLRVTVDEDGRTRIKQRFIISAPLAGRLQRVTLKEGHPVKAGETLLAVIEAPDPSLLDPRAKAEAEARVAAAEAALERAEAALGRAEASLKMSSDELARIRAAHSDDAVTRREVERAESLVSIDTQDRRAAGHARDVARYELALARAALTHRSGRMDAAPPGGQGAPPAEERASPGAAADAGDWRFELISPIDGRVLRLLKESSTVVTAGTPILEIGDAEDLELVVDVLSSDGVAVRPGAAASLEHWGGERPLNGRVRLVEPSAFTKISALGVEEQRVNVIIDFTDPPAERVGLGDGFRIDARITVWEESSVLKVPAGALFRHATSWAVYRVVDGRATVQDVEVGRRSGTEAQILRGLQEGDQVIVYPSDRVRGGVRVAPATTSVG